MARNYDQIRKQLASNIRRRRGFKDMSQEALALAAETDRSYISQVERCIGNPSLLVLSKIADALDVDIQELFADRATIGPDTVK
ncbi:helix-turn-helix domain-containing protein [Duganella sp. FT50W]|uniref:Helix-turn-helix domain-containing protein n=1 Tax=Duganella lactea TaxID=2692173 RepID=A0A6L8MLF6_9BURK|nr:helix-turn-helix transcriptional regulator [Duganella lactea]MYM82636.1 helix-turn-helix domain-containing protein [Duganella lactea]